MPRKSKTPSGKVRIPPKPDSPNRRDRSDIERGKNNLQSNDRATQELERIAERFKIGLQRVEWERRVGAPLPIDLKTLDQSNYLSRSAEYRAFWDVYGEALHDTQGIEGMVMAREIAFRCFPELVGHPPPEALVEPGNEVFLTPAVLVIRGFDPETHPDFDPENESVPQSYTAGGTFLYKQDVTKERYIRVQLDLSEDTENLLERTKAVINEAKRLVGRDKSRRRDLPRDFWKIVDTAKKIGTSSAAAVMETIDPMERKPYGSAGELSPELWKLGQRKRETERKRIEHAIKLAQKMRLLSPDSAEET